MIASAINVYMNRGRQIMEDRICHGANNGTGSVHVLDLSVTDWLI
jgi:hypothetical protein